MVNYKSTIKKIPKSIREITIELDAPATDECFKKAVRHLSQELEIEGFRKGKVPPAMAEKYIRSDALFDEAAHIAIRETYPEAIREHGLEAVGRPDIDVTKIAKGGVLEYKVRVAVLDEAEPPDWRKVQVKKNPITPKPEELEKALSYLQKSRTQYVAADRPARKGDFLEIDFTIRSAGVILENGNAQKHPFVLGEGRFVPGFEEQIEGMRVNEEKDFSLTFPQDYVQKAYAGRPVDCSVKLVTLLDRVLPERNDAFAQSVGEFKTFEELENSVREGIVREKESEEKLRARIDAISKISEKMKMEFPDVLVDREVEKMFLDLEERVSGMSLSFESYLEHLKKTREELAKEWRPEGEKRVRIALALRAIAKAEHIEPSQEEIEEKIKDILKGYPSPKDAKKQYDESSLRAYAKQVVSNEKVFELLEQHCIVN